MSQSDQPCQRSAERLSGAPEDFEDERQRILVALCDELQDTATVTPPPTPA